MIRLIEALNFRCLRYVSQPMQNFQILVGPNASGKTTFLDVLGFISDLLRGGGIDSVIRDRGTNIQDLFFGGHGDRFELAVELEIPHPRIESGQKMAEWKRARYELQVGLGIGGSYDILDEQVLLLHDAVEQSNANRERLLFPSPPEPPQTLMASDRAGNGRRRTIRKKYRGNDNYYSELASRQGKGGWAPSFRLGPKRSALANLPGDEQKFPVSSWLREVLSDGIRSVVLNSMALRRSSPPGQGDHFLPDGSNLPWVIENLRRDHLERHRNWVEHVQTALEDLEDVSTGEFEDTKHRYLRLHYKGGLAVPCWTASDGTLRLLALTLLAYVPELHGIYMIEEPENGIHPMVMDTVYKSLSSVYQSQIFIATHSPVLLRCAEPSDVLCFKKDLSGATDIVEGSRHPGYERWRNEYNLADMHASGVLG